MSIITILFILLGIYIPVYGGMICYDLFIKKGPAELIPKQDDEDVDISDEAGKFQPIVIERERKDNGSGGKRADPQSGEQPQGKGKEDVKDGKPLPDNSSPPEVPQAMVIDEEDEPRNRKSLSDTGKRKDKIPSVELTDEEKAKLVKFERIKQQRLDKFKQEVKEKPPKTENQEEKEAVPKLQTDEVKPSSEQTNKKKTKKEASVPSNTELEAESKTPAKPATQRKRYESPKKVMPMPEGHKAPVFEPTVRIADDAGQTKLTGAQTVEQLEEEVTATLADDMAFAQKQLESLWILSKSELEPEVREEDILRPPDNADGTARKATTFNLPT